MIQRTYKISDVVNDEFLRFPLTLLANPKYKKMSLESKFIYSLLLNRMTLSQRNGWINEDNEVYLIYTREDAASMLNISYKKTISAFKELIENGLLYEKRQGRGYPNLLYVLKTELADSNAKDFSEKYNEIPDEPLSQEVENHRNSLAFPNGISRTANSAHQGMSKKQVKNGTDEILRTADLKSQDVPKLHAKKIDNINNEFINIESNQLVSPLQEYDNEQIDCDSKTLSNIFEKCELEIFKPNIQNMIRSAIERLYYSETLKIGNARLPQSIVRNYLNYLDCECVMNALESMKQNESTIVNPTAYMMSTLFNSICDKDSGLILNLPSEYLNNDDIYMPLKDFPKEVTADAPE